MSHAETTIEMLFVTDRDGRVISAAFPVGAEVSRDGHNTTFAPLPGQQIHSVHVPVVLAQLNGHQLHMVLSQARIEPANSRLILPEINIHHRGHPEEKE
jgi:hypothetical protein